MNYLTRDAIINASDIKTEEVPVPEWGGTVVVRSLSGRERDMYQATLVLIQGVSVASNMANATAKLVQLSVIDPETKTPLFSEGDIDVLSNKSASALQRVFSVAQRLSGLGRRDMETLAKNSSATQSDTSATN